MTIKSTVFSPPGTNCHPDSDLIATLEKCSRWAPTLAYRLEYVPETYPLCAAYIQKMLIPRGLWQSQDLKERDICDPALLAQTSALLHDFQYLIGEAHPTNVCTGAVSPFSFLLTRQRITQLRTLGDKFKQYASDIAGSISQYRTFQEDLEAYIHSPNEELMFPMDDIQAPSN